MNRRSKAKIWTKPRAIQYCALLLGFVSFCCLPGCSSLDPFDVFHDRSSGEITGGRSTYAEGTQRFPSGPIQGEVPPPKPKRVPWEIWPTGFDLSGARVDQPFVIRGDEYLRQGLREAALTEYRKALAATPLTAPTQEAVVLRISSTELALDQPQRALATLSDFFRRQSRKVDDVDAHYSLVFGYAYGRLGEFDQALAWFSRVNRLVSGVGGVAQSAQSGVTLLLRSLSEQQFASLNESWVTDLFVSNLIGQERRRRMNRNYASLIEVRHSPRFWERDDVETVNVAPRQLGGPIKIGVILPLSGKFSNLGAQVRQGIELASAGQEANSFTEVIFKDDQGDTALASAAARELIVNDQVAVILGPLLAEPSVAVSEIARQSGVAQLSFSKQATFPTGEMVFRLGPTVQSQIDSLIEVVARQQRISRFGLVYPQDPAAQEYVQAFRVALNSRNLPLAYEVSYIQADGPTFVQVGAELEQAGVQAVFLPDTLRAAASFLGSMPQTLRGKLRLLGAATWDDTLQLEQNRAALENVTFVSPFFPGSRRPIVNQFIETFNSKYGRKPNFLAAQGFDAATMLLAAVRKQTEDGTAFTAAFRGISVYDGLTGVTSVDPTGELRRQFSVVQFRREGLVDLMEEPAVDNTAPAFVYRGDLEVATDQTL